MVLDELAVCLGERTEWLFRVREGSLEGVGLAFEADGNARDRQCADADPCGEPSHRERVERLSSSSETLSRPSGVSRGVD